jgi:hypothetical protein
MKLSITNNFPAVAAAMDRLDQQVRMQASVSAVNKTLDQARTQMARAIVQRFNLPSATVKDQLKVRGAMSGRGKLSIEGSLVGGDGRRKSLNMIRFMEKKTTMAQAKRRAKAGTLDQLFVQVRKDKPAKALEGAFIGNQGRTIFRREGKDRLSLKPVQVIDVQQMFTTKAINAAVQQFIFDKFPVIFEREASYFTQRAFGGRK